MSEIGAPAEPAGPELLSLSRSEFTLAPGRDEWLYASTFIRVSTSTMTTVTPKVTFESSNTNAAPVRLEYGACAVTLLAYRTPERAGKPVWSSDFRKPYGLSKRLR
jgi:hypothetical protein